MDEQAAHSMVLEALSRAVSQNPEELKIAEEKLREWEKIPGFHSILMNIFNNYEIDYNIRLMAILYCKNGINRYWRKNAPNAISEEEKSYLRTGFLKDFNEPLPHLAIQKAVLISKIARFDWPDEWSCLFDVLINTAKSGETYMICQRATLILHHIVKNLVSKRLIGARRSFMILAQQLFPTVFSLWVPHTEMTIAKFDKNLDEAKKHLDNALLLLKILGLLTIQGFQKPSESADVNNFLKMIFPQMKAMMESRLKLNESYGPLDQYISKLMSTLINLLKEHPLSFVEYIRPSVELAVYYAFTPEGSQYIFRRFLIQCFNLVHSVIICPEFVPSKHSEDSNRKETLEADIVKKAVFDKETVSNLCRTLVTHYFLISQEDLNLWLNDPESFIDTGSQTWMYSFRGSCETLFSVVLHEYHSDLAPVIVNLATTHYGPVDMGDLHSILLKDAVYNAIGLAAFDLYNEINFDDWLTNRLKQEASELDGKNGRILKRRIACLIGSWTGVKLSAQLYPDLYELLLPLLHPNEDLVVRITAADAVHSIIDNFEFDVELFKNYLEPVYHSLFHLLKEVAECNTKMRILVVIQILIERVGSTVEPYVYSLVGYLPLLWNDSESHNMLRFSVVNTLVNLVRALGKLCANKPEICDFILAVIGFSTETSNSNHVYLLEEALELWRTFLENLPCSTPALLDLYENLFPVIVNATEHLHLCMTITQAYILLAPDVFLKRYGQRIIDTVMDQVKDLKREGIAIILRMLELMIRASPEVGVILLKPMLPMIFKHVYDGDEHSTLIILSLAITSRLLMTSQETFIETLNHVAVNMNKSVNEVMSGMVKIWMKNMPLGPTEKSKLLALALSILLNSQHEFLEANFCGILLAVAEVLNDITEVKEGGVLVDNLVYTEDRDDISTVNDSDDDDGWYPSNHLQRRKQLAISDPVHKVPLHTFFFSQLNSLRSMIGNDKFKDLMETVDAETLDMVRKYVAL